jgi:hypothetical protein
MGLFGFGDKRSTEEIQAENKKLREEILQAGKDWEKFGRFKGKVVSTEVVTCYKCSEEGMQAVLLISEDGTIKVRCQENCYDCKYGECLPHRY